MRRLVAALVVALLSLAVVGCGGGEEPATPAADTGAQAPVAPPVTPGAQAAAVTDRSALSGETFEPFKVENVPANVQQRLETRQAMLLFFYNPAQLQTDDLREQINDVVSENRGNIDLLAYDLSKYTSVTASGYVEVEQEALLEDTKATEAVRFARAAGVDHVPFIIIVDDQGHKIFWSRGFIDARLLDRQIQRAVR